MKNKTEKWQVMPTSITRQSLLVLPDPGYHTPKISLQMDTELAHVLANSANALPDLLNACREFHETRQDVPWNCKAMTDAANNLSTALANAERVAAMPNGAALRQPTDDV